MRVRGRQANGASNTFQKAAASALSLRYASLHSLVHCQIVYTGVYVSVSVSISIAASASVAVAAAV